jgi:hypothetical protein
MDNARSAPEPDQRQLDAIRRQREAAAALGRERVQILEYVLVLDLSWRDHAQRRGLTCDVTARGEVIDAIRALAVNQTGTAVPPYRFRRRAPARLRA